MRLVDDPAPRDPTRRTRLAQERTLLAWWRTGLAAVAVAVGFGRLLPALLDEDPLPFALVGAGFGLLAVAMFVLGARRDREVQRALAEGRFEPLAGSAVWTLSIGFALLSVAALVLVVLGA